MKVFIEYCILLQSCMLVKYCNFSLLSSASPHKTKPVKRSFTVTVNKVFAFVLFFLSKFQQRETSMLNVRHGQLSHKE